jgi:hypothetical protein
VSKEGEGSALGKSQLRMLKHFDVGVGNSSKEKLFEVVSHVVRFMGLCVGQVQAVALHNLRSCGCQIWVDCVGSWMDGYKEGLLADRLMGSCKG